MRNELKLSKICLPLIPLLLIITSRFGVYFTSYLHFKMTLIHKFNLFCLYITPFSFVHAEEVTGFNTKETSAAADQAFSFFNRQNIKK